MPHLRNQSRLAHHRSQRRLRLQFRIRGSRRSFSLAQFLVGRRCYPLTVNEYSKELEALFVHDDNGKPLVLYHGTRHTFDHFSDEYLQSIGFHFGCITQAKFFAGDGADGRIISAYLSAHNLADIRPSDFGWLQPQVTVVCLHFANLINEAEATELLDGGDLSLASYRHHIESLEKRQLLNRRLMALLETKGYDGIIYSNKQEPPDGVLRDAYLVFHANQIFPISWQQP